MGKSGKTVVNSYITPSTLRFIESSPMSKFIGLLPGQDSATGRGIKTALQAVVGSLVGLVVTVWAVPGVPEAVFDYVQKNLVQILLMVGIPSGVASFVWNYFRKDVKNY